MGWPTVEDIKPICKSSKVQMCNTDFLGIQVTLQHPSSFYLNICYIATDTIVLYIQNFSIGLTCMKRFDYFMLCISVMGLMGNELLFFTCWKIRKILISTGVF